MVLPKELTHRATILESNLREVEADAFMRFALPTKAKIKNGEIICVSKLRISENESISILTCPKFPDRVDILHKIGNESTLYNFESVVDTRRERGGVHLLG